MSRAMHRAVAKLSQVWPGKAGKDPCEIEASCNADKHCRDEISDLQKGDNKRLKRARTAHRLGWLWVHCALAQSMAMTAPSLAMARVFQPMAQSEKQQNTRLFADAWGLDQPDLEHRRVRTSGLGLLSASASVQAVVQGSLHWGDHQGWPFFVVDKKQARVYVFSATGRLLGEAPALLGLALGDLATPGMGDRPLSQIRPKERITPAGRFVAEMGRNTAGQTILWVDYEQAISIHPVRSLNPQERRLERLASNSAQDKRITYGCINVPLLFWRTVVLPTFQGTQGVVYVLPDQLSLDALFGQRLWPTKTATDK
jgi:hypothetical protein